MRTGNFILSDKMYRVCVNFLSFLNYSAMVHLPTDVVSHIDLFTPRCPSCKTPWTSDSNYVFDYYFTEHVPDSWHFGDFSVECSEEERTNHTAYPVSVSFDTPFMKEFIKEPLYNRFRFYDYSHPDFQTSVDKFSVDFRGLCSDCSSDLSDLSCMFLTAYCEHMLSSTTFNAPFFWDCIHVARVKNVYLNDRLLYILIRFTPLYEYHNSLLFSAMFGDIDVEPEHALLFPLQSVIGNIVSGNARLVFPKMFFKWQLFLYQNLCLSCEESMTPSEVETDIESDTESESDMDTDSNSGYGSADDREE